MMTDPTTTVVMNTDAPSSSQRPISTTELFFEEKAAILENTSGAPFPSARKVTPATSYVSFNCQTCNTEGA
jgi:hypothetical protein